MKKEAKRILAFSLLALVMFSLIASLVLAADGAETAAETTKGVLTGVRDFTAVLLNPLFGDTQLLTRLLLAILLGLIIYNIVPLIIGGGKKTLSLFISAIIVILAMLAIPSNFLDAIVTQYGAMGAAILSVIPFVIILITSVRIMDPLIARVLWAFYTVYYFALYLYKMIITKAGFISAETIPYIAAIVAGVIMLFVIVKVQKIIFKGKMGALKESGERIIARGQLLHKLNKEELEKVYGAGAES